MRPALRVIDPQREMRDVWLRCDCTSVTGRPRPGCVQCGGSGMHLARLPSPRKEA